MINKIRRFYWGFQKQQKNQQNKNLNLAIYSYKSEVVEHTAQVQVSN